MRGHIKSCRPFRMLRKIGAKSLRNVSGRQLRIGANPGVGYLVLDITDLCSDLWSSDNPNYGTKTGCVLTI